MTQTPSRLRGRCGSWQDHTINAYCGLREAVAEPVPEASSDVPLLECWASIAPVPFVATAPLRVSAFTPPAPARLAEDVGFGAVAAAEGVAVGLAFGAVGLAFGLDCCA